MFRPTDHRSKGRPLHAIYQASSDECYFAMKPWLTKAYRHKYRLESFEIVPESSIFQSSSKKSNLTFRKVPNTASGRMFTLLTSIKQIFPHPFTFILSFLPLVCSVCSLTHMGIVKVCVCVFHCCHFTDYSLMFFGPLVAQGPPKRVAALGHSRAATLSEAGLLLLCWVCWGAGLASCHRESGVIYEHEHQQMK